MSEAAPGVFYLSKHRLETLTDGIFAVAMTLLVIDLKIPETAQIETQEQLIAAVLHLIPKFIGPRMPGDMGMFLALTSGHRIIRPEKHVQNPYFSGLQLVLNTAPSLAMVMSLSAMSFRAMRMVWK